VTLDGYIISWDIQNGLAYMDMAKSTDQECNGHSCVVLIMDNSWDPCVKITMAGNMTILERSQWY